MGRTVRATGGNRASTDRFLELSMKICFNKKKDLITDKLPVCSAFCAG